MNNEGISKVSHAKGKRGTFGTQTSDLANAREGGLYRLPAYRLTAYINEEVI
jgi:hypothetical protein